MSETLNLSGRTISRWETLVNVTIVLILFYSTELLYRFKRGNRESFLPMPVRILIVIVIAFAISATLNVWCFSYLLEAEGVVRKYAKEPSPLSVIPARAAAPIN